MGRRTSHSCQTCRERHLKCNFKTTPCDNCAKADRECRPSPWFQFRPVSEVERLRTRHRRRCDTTPSRVDRPGHHGASHATPKDSVRGPSTEHQVSPHIMIVDETPATMHATTASSERADPPDELPLNSDNGTLDSRSSWGALSADAQGEQDQGTDNSPRFSATTVWCESSLERPILDESRNRSDHENRDGQTALQDTSSSSIPRFPAEGNILQSIADGAELNFSVDTPYEARNWQNGGHNLTPSCISALPTEHKDVHLRPFALNKVEAGLFRHFIQVWGPLIDSTDESRQFSTCVPHLAKTESPCLMYAIFALVSCQLSRTSGYSPQTSKLYRKKCAQVLVSILLSDPDSIHEASIFATYVLLRVYDHLHITATLSQRRPESLFSDALALSIQPWHAYSSHAALKQAAFWVHLRQDIHVALQLECTVQVDHTLYEQTVAVAVQITEEDLMRRNSTGQQDENECSPETGDLNPEKYNPKVDCAWTNRLIGLTCQVINYCFDPQQQSTGKWASLMAEVDLWNFGKPETFEPFFEQALGSAEGNPFPTIHLLNDWHVLGLMYYHLSVILLKSYRPGQRCTNKDPRTIRCDIRDDLIHHVNVLCGIVWTNPTDQALLIVPAMLNVSACLFSDVRCQKGVLDLLDQASKQIGAHSSTIAGRLINTWNSQSGR